MSKLNSAKKNSLIFRIFRITGIALGSVLFLMFLTPYLFPTLVSEQVKKWANSHIEGELNFSKVSLSFFHRFPSLTFTLYDFSLKGSKPFVNDTLVSSDEISLGINLKKLFFDKKVNINKVFLTNAVMNIQVNEKGEANYNVYISDSTGTSSSSSGEGGNMEIEHIEINDSHLIYNDGSIPLLINAQGFNYQGKGDLSKSIFQLKTKATIDSLDFYFDNEPYVLGKRIDARLVTSINTNSLAFVFERNRLKINQLPLEFTGKLNFLDNGYDMDFAIASGKTELYNLITALPPSYNTWLQSAKVDGSTEVGLTLKGQYIVAENKMPDLSFSMNVRDGYVAYDKVSVPASAIHLDLGINMPALNADSISLNMDTLSLKIEQSYLHARLATKGVASPAIDMKGMINTEMDLEKLDRAFGFTDFDLKGICKINGHVNGRYVAGSGIVPKQFPEANLAINLNNGSIKTVWYPQPIERINLVTKITDVSGTVNDLDIQVAPASFMFEGKPFSLKVSLHQFDDIAYDISMDGELDFERIYKVFSQKGLGLKGTAIAALHLEGKQSDAMSGKYDQLNNEGSLDLRNIAISSQYLTKPFVIKEGLFHFKQDKMNFNNFTASYGTSDFKMNGSLQNVINYILADNGTLKGQFSLSSNLTNLDEFMAVTSSSDTLAISDSVKGVIMIPRELDLSIKAKVAKVLFNELTLQNFSGDLALKNSKAILKQTGFNLIGCNVSMDATYESLSPDRAAFDYKVNAADFDVQRAYKEIALFREMAPSAATAEGIISIDYHLKGKLNADMFPVFPSLTGGGTLSVKDVKVKGFKLFNAVSSKTGKDDLRDPTFKKVDLKTTIKNNIITLERVKMKVAGFRPRIEGQTSFDGRLNLKMRLGLPPLGIIGIPIKVTGTQEKPIIKLGTKTEDLTETVDEEDD